MAQDRASADESSGSVIREVKPTPEVELTHPSILLLRRLNQLELACSNASMFRDLDERRRSALALHLRNRRVLDESAAKHPIGFLKGAVTAVGAMFSHLQEIDAAPVFVTVREPEEHTAALRAVLDDGMSLCKAAKSDLRAGGAAEWDAHTLPNAAGQSRSIEVHMKLQEADRTFAALWFGVSLPGGLLDRHAGVMEGLGKWFGLAADEFSAVLETRGIGSARQPHNENAQSPNAMSTDIHRPHVALPPASAATQFRPTAGDLASAAGISNDTFRRIRRSAGVEVNATGGAARNRRYAPIEVDRMIAAALAGNHLERLAIATKWTKWSSKKPADTPHGRK